MFHLHNYFIISFCYPSKPEFSVDQFIMLLDLFSISFNYSYKGDSSIDVSAVNLDTLDNAVTCSEYRLIQ